MIIQFSDYVIVLCCGGLGQMKEEYSNTFNQCIIVKIYFAAIINNKSEILHKFKLLCPHFEQ